MEEDTVQQHNVIVRFFKTLWRIIWEIWLDPFLLWANLYEPADRTYGRWDIPFSPMEKRLHANPDVTVNFYKVMMPNNKDWVWYQVWEDKLAQRATGRVADMVFCHGTGVHSGTLASHSRRYLDAGYRLIVPDLPSHGYSTGTHVYQRKMIGYVSGVHQVIVDVARRDDEQSGMRIPKQERRKTFLLGLSFGGLVAILYPIYYPASVRDSTTDMDEVPVDGVVAVGPIVNWSRNDVKTPILMYIVGYFVSIFHASRMELFVPHKKAVDKDPKVYKQLIDTDKRSHRGAFRVGHLFCIRDAVEDTLKYGPDFTMPIYIQHGLQDRVVEVGSSVNFLRLIASKDKKMTVYPVCQHVIYRKAKTEEEDAAGRIAVLEDNIEWMNARCPGHGHIDRGVSFSSEYDIGQQDTSGLGTPIDPKLAKPDAVVTETISKLTGEANARSSAVLEKTGLVDRTNKKDKRRNKTRPTAEDEDWSDIKRVYREEWQCGEEYRPFDLII
ncbi:hypothetical protein MVES1_003427 [Malassezia vespertilionis]|uniref:uncharacterized protein n=1 Tax=Malassezia vespertilionis TaxID=2020962 RepID=UPI0024B1225F|nr:uncharacterized protein MVES1_003427 [Malassezia vespertilionis]WFD08058.1 hypothetical protein MVES1_003427 [Malassezia vespertilionis]